MPRRVIYLLEYAFTFTFCVTGIPADLRIVQCLRRMCACTRSVVRELIPKAIKPARVNQIKLAYDTMSAGWPAPIATSAFNQLCQYAYSPGTGPLLCITRRFFPSGDLEHRQYSLCLPTEGWPG